MEVDFYLSSLMASKICHDLIGSSSALTFSLGELSKEGEDNKDATSLAFQSANVLINRLKYFRAAFGISFCHSNRSLVDDLRSLVFDLYKEKDIYLDWEVVYDSILEGYLNNIHIKLILNIFLIIFDTVPKNAAVTVIMSPLEGHIIGISLKVKGYKVALQEEVLQILRGQKLCEYNAINPRNFNLYFTYFLKQQANSIIAVNNNAENKGLNIAFTLANP